MSFCVDSDNAADLDFPMDLTDVITLTYLHPLAVEVRIKLVGTALDSGLQGESLTRVRKNLLLQAA